MKKSNRFAVLFSMLSVAGLAACAGGAPSGDAVSQTAASSVSAGAATPVGVFSITQFSPAAGSYSAIPTQVQVTFSETNISQYSVSNVYNWTFVCGAQSYSPTYVSLNGSIASVSLPTIQNQSVGTTCTLNATSTILDTANNALSGTLSAAYTIASGAGLPTGGSGGGYNPQGQSIVFTSSVGGSGGGGFSEAGYTGTTLNGFQIHSDNLVEQIVPVWMTNYGGNSYASYPGNSHGNATGTAGGVYCPATGNQRVVGIFGRSGALVDQLGIICQPQDGSSTALYYSPTVGGNGGGPYQLLCPQGKFVMGIYGRSGASLDQIGLACQ